MNIRRQDKICAGKGLVLIAALPFLLYALSSGPEPRLTGAPGDRTCAVAGCHTGTAVNGGPGRVEITFPSGLTYVPGQRQRWTVTVTDAAQRVFGFQATARLESNQTAGQAGTFHSIDATTEVLCDDGRIKPAAGCPANLQVEFVQHRRAGAANTFTFEWTPPATNVGNVRVYVAGNAANGNGTSLGDRVYTANYTLSPSAGGGGGPRPTFTAAAVADAWSFVPGIAPNTWTAIFGSNLATTTRTWDAAIQGNRLPTSLEGVTVSINNRPATIHFVSPGQINVLPPLDIGTGDVSVVITTPNGASDPVTVRAAAFKPSFYAPFSQNNRLYVTAVALDGTIVGRAGADPRVTRGARPGEILQVFGTGFGPTNPAVPTDQIVSGAPSVATPVRIRFGETVASVAGSGNLVFAGLYQFNVTVPNTLADGDHQLIAEIGGVTSSTNVYITVQR